MLLAAFLLPCCGGLAVLGALAGDPVPGAPAADRRAAAEGPAGPASEVGGTGAAVVPAETATTVPPTTTATTAPATTAPATTAPTAAARAAAPKVTTAAPVVVKRRVTATQKVAFGTRTVRDPSLAEGTTKVRTKGVPGVRTLTYEVTTADGVQTGRRLLRNVVTKKPVSKVIAVGTRAASEGCHPNYSGCVPIADDVDCAGGSGDGPAYVNGPVRVTGADVYRLDRDGDKIACDD